MVLAKMSQPGPPIYAEVVDTMGSGVPQQYPPQQYPPQQHPPQQFPSVQVFSKILLTV